MRARRSNAHNIRRHDKASGSWWLLLVCALLLAAPSSAAISLNTARSTAQVEAVFAMLQASQAPLESRAALQVLCERAGLDELSTARLLSSFERWNHAQASAPSTCTLPSSTCTRLDASRSLLTTAFIPYEAPIRTHARIKLFLE